MTEVGDAHAIDGFYAGYFTGESGGGFAVFVFRSGQIAGADALGVEFAGSYHAEPKAQGYFGKVNVKAPSSAVLVQGLTAGPNGLSYEVEFTLPDNFLDHDYLTLQTPLGPVNLKLTRLGPINV
jgi:hypothetical protein